MWKQKFVLEFIKLWTIITTLLFMDDIPTGCRWQWPHGLRHKLSSLARKLGSWVRVLLKAWMSVLGELILCLCCCVCRYRPCDVLIPRPRSLPTVYRNKKLKNSQGSTKGCRAIIIIPIDYILDHQFFSRQKEVLFKYYSLNTERYWDYITHFLIQR
jgi:hypothetical protein